MGYKHREASLAHVKASLEAPNFLLKIIPHVDGRPRIYRAPCRRTADRPAF
jgi:acetoacetate decarboxylase